MRIVVSVKDMQRRAQAWKREGRRIALVPTMGYLHRGHMSLALRARRRVGRDGMVVLSIYVNPTQFAPTEDLAKYPRDLERDCKLCREAGVDVVFAPTNPEMYPSGAARDYSTYVVEEQLSQSMEGASRPTHFRGVTTVVAKLFNLVLPNLAVFGSKDFQQAAVGKRMCADLNFPVEIVVSPTVRETDGMAMSSRNKFLSPEERNQATVLWRAIELARQLVRDTPSPIPAGRLVQRLQALIESEPAARLDYVAFFDPNTLEPLKRVGPGGHLALAVYIGRTRLIDNGGLADAPG